jgi:hypothetical protein
MSQDLTKLVAALKLLASHDPDRAVSRNNVGFSQAHTHLGHTLLAMPLECWSANAVAAAEALCWHYRKQLAADGMVDVVTSDPGISLAGFRRGEDLQWIDFDSDKAEYGVHTRYDPALVQRIKELPGRRWDGIGKCWRVASWARDEVRNFASKEHIPLSDEASRAEAGERPKPKVTYAPRQPRPHLIDVADADHLSISFEYDAAIVEAAKRIGGRWRPPTWVVPLRPVEKIEDFADRYGFGLTDEAMQIIDLINFQKVMQSRSELGE